MKYLITCLILAMLAGCDQASETTGKTDTDSGVEVQAVPVDVKEPHGRVFERGIYNATRKGRIRDEITANTGKIITKPVLELAEQTDRIPLVKGTYFAYRYRILNLPKEEARKPAVELRKVLIHPEMDLPDGSATTGTERTFKGRTSAGQVIGYDGYAFNEDYELVEGEWTFQIWFQDHLLVEQVFTTYWPEDGTKSNPGTTEPAIHSK